MISDPAHLLGTPPLLDLACVCANARRAGRAATQLYDAVLAPSGVRIAQFIILRVLYRMGPVSQSQLGDVMAVAPETLSRRLELMRRAGWIELRTAKDRRKKIYVLTKTGRENFECAFPYWKRAQKRLEMLIGKKRIEQITSDLNLLAEISRQAISARLSNVA